VIAIQGVPPGTEMHREAPESSAQRECRGGRCQLGDKVLDCASGELAVCVSGLSSESFCPCYRWGKRMITEISSVENL